MTTTFHQTKPRRVTEWAAFNERWVNLRFAGAETIIATRNIYVECGVFTQTEFAAIMRAALVPGFVS